MTPWMRSACRDRDPDLSVLGAIPNAVRHLRNNYRRIPRCAACGLQQAVARCVPTQADARNPTRLPRVRPCPAARRLLPNEITPTNIHSAWVERCAAPEPSCCVSCEPSHSHTDSFRRTNSLIATTGGSSGAPRLPKRVLRHRLTVIGTTMRAGCEPFAVEDLQAALGQALTADRAPQPSKNHQKRYDYCRACRARGAVDSHIVRRTVEHEDPCHRNPGGNPFRLPERALLSLQVVADGLRGSHGAQDYRVPHRLSTTRHRR
jgi:hypothetical protein